VTFRAGVAANPNGRPKGSWKSDKRSWRHFLKSFPHLQTNLRTPHLRIQHPRALSAQQARHRSGSAVHRHSLPGPVNATVNVLNSRGATYPLAACHAPVRPADGSPTQKRRSNKFLFGAIKRTTNSFAERGYNLLFAFLGAPSCQNEMSVVPSTPKARPRPLARDQIGLQPFTWRLSRKLYPGTTFPRQRHREQNVGRTRFAAGVADQAYRS
jgi:hypothetical protein